MTIAETADLLSDAAIDDPYPLFAALRAEGPVVWLPKHRAWFLSTHDEVSTAFRDLRLSSDRLTPLETRVDDRRRELLAGTFELLRGWMVFHDPPDHERLRRPLSRTFTPKRIEALRPRVAEVVAELLAGLAAKGDEADLIADFAFPLPAIVIAELLGVPPEDRDRFKTWSELLAAIVFGASNRDDQAEQAAAGSAQFVEYFGWLIDRYTDQPADNLVSALIAVTRDDPQEAGLTPSELVGACTLLLFGGHETTTNLIGNSVRSLLHHPDQLAVLRRDPDLLGPALEELHRYDGSTKVMVRIVGEAHERSGVEVAAGDTVLLGVASANRDPAAFVDADRLRLDRADPQRHLGFGYGIHFCLGAFLARLEAQEAIGALLAAFPDLGPGERDGEWNDTLLGRGLRSLPVRLR
ncbi:MAG: cytochrome P450 [Actinomycetota bacterium]